MKSSIHSLSCQTLPFLDFYNGKHESLVTGKIRETGAWHITTAVLQAQTLITVRQSLTLFTQRKLKL